MEGRLVRPSLRRTLIECIIAVLAASSIAGLTYLYHTNPDELVMRDILRERRTELILIPTTIQNTVARKYFLSLSVLHLENRSELSLFCRERDGSTDSVTESAKTAPLQLPILLSSGSAGLR